MGTLVNIVIADEDEAEAIGESNQPVDEWVGLEARDLDKSKFITLHCLLTGDGIEDGANAVARLDQLHQVTDIADETKRDLVVGPLPPIAPPLQHRIALADGEGTLLQFREFHRPPAPTLPGRP